MLELEISGNRPDLLSVYGIAREVAALLRRELVPAARASTPSRAGDEPVDIRIEDHEACPRYIGRIFRDVSIGPSPAWLRARLLAAGMRPISNVVDVTNYVMLGARQPAARVRPRHARGRPDRRPPRHAPARSSARSTASERELEPTDLVIADAERPVALAGIMGGEETRDPRRRRPTSCSRRPTSSADGALAHLRAAAPAHRGLEPLGEGRRPVPRRAGGASTRRELHRRPRRRALGRPRRRRTRSSRAPGRQLPAGARRAAHRPRHSRSDGAARPLDAARLRASTGRPERDSCRLGARATSRVGSTSIEEVARFRIEEVPFTLPVRRDDDRPADAACSSSCAACRGHLVGAGLSEVVHAVARRGDDAHPDAIRLARADHDRARGAAHGPFCRRPHRGRAAQRGASATSGIALFEIAHIVPPARRRPARGAAGTSRAIVEGGFAGRRAIVEALLPRADAPASWEPDEHALFHPGKSARDGDRRRSASSTRAARRDVGRLRARPRGAPRRRARDPFPVRGRDHVSRGEAGPRVRRRRGRSPPAT